MNQNMASTQHCANLTLAVPTFQALLLMAGGPASGGYLSRWRSRLFRPCSSWPADPLAEDTSHAGGPDFSGPAPHGRRTR
jgi:hypothetical protein